MAQPGDTITYTFSGSRVQENISGVETFEVLYCEAGRDENGNQFGGRAENVVVDVASHNDLYIWVGEAGTSDVAFGRYDGQYGGPNSGAAGSSEVSLKPTEQGDSPTEPFIVGAGGAGGGAGGIFGSDVFGARNSSGNGEPPPQGGNATQDGDAAVDGHGGTAATIVSSGTTIKGGGPDGNGEIKISYKKASPDAPTNLTATFTQ